LFTGIVCPYRFSAISSKKEILVRTWSWHAQFRKIPFALTFLSHCRGCVVAVECHAVVHPTRTGHAGVLVNASKGTAQRAFDGLPNYPAKSLAASSSFCNVGRSLTRVPTNRCYRPAHRSRCADNCGSKGTSKKTTDPFIVTNCARRFRQPFFIISSGNCLPWPRSILQQRP
jgi:hypothetical protein